MSEDQPHRLPERDRPWMMRTYAGHSTAKASNELYRRNLEKGQTGLSVAFDLPTQTGYDPDDELARGEVGKVGVPIAHRGDMQALMEGIPLGEMNTSMTINATAAWLLALYIVAAETQGVAPEQLQGTTQNDIIKEFLARGTYAFPPAPSMRLIADTIAYTVEHVPKWNPINICSYHLQEAGATPVQEIAYAMSNAIAVLDAVRDRIGMGTPPRRAPGGWRSRPEAGKPGPSSSDSGGVAHGDPERIAEDSAGASTGDPARGAQDSAGMSSAPGSDARSPGEPAHIAQVFGRISFFVNAGVRFVEEHAKLRAMGILWEELGRERYGVEDPRLLRLRYGVQVNSLGLTEAQPENNVQRIVLEALAVTIGRDARARAIQLPAWNEALGLPRPWDQQWSLRIQQVLAYETDILEYPDIFEGSRVMEGLVAELLEGARAEMAVVAEHGGAVEAVPYMKAALVDSHRERLRRIEAREQTVVGQNRFTESEESPLTADAEGGILVVDPAVEAEQIEAVRRWRAQRDQAAVDAALADLARAAADPDQNLMEPTIAAARAGATTGEWSATLREVFGSYRAPTGVGEASGAPAEELDAPGAGAGGGEAAQELARVREQVATLAERLGRRPKILVGKPGLDGHSNGAEQIAVRARDAGMDVVYEGIRLTPAQIAASALQEGVHVIGLSILSGSHRELIPAVLDALREAGVTAPVVVGGIIPEQDVAALKQAGVAAVYTPKDFDLTRIVADIVELVGERSGAVAAV
ncbi:MAG TPA: protein meaA [Solirubrobacteraceae bacterium]|jgi:(2R)-ethylmalonyl-CoA mutase|nr:protein meaA [Solirubrobacteraceae bacterium]